MTVDLIPDAEVVAIAWAKADADLGALGVEIASTLPRNPEAKFPFLRGFRVGGGRDAAEAPIDGALLQWDAYSVHGDYATASLVARTLVAKAERAGNFVTAGGFVYGMTRSSGPRRVDEPVTGWARYQVDLVLTLRGGS